MENNSTLKKRKSSPISSPRPKREKKEKGYGKKNTVM